MRPLTALLAGCLLVSSLFADEAAFDADWSAAASAPEAVRAVKVDILLAAARDPSLTPQEKLSRLWKIYLVAKTADEHRAILREAATIDDVAARMLVGVYRFNDEFSKELAKDQAAANKAQLKLLHDGKDTLDYKSLPENSYDTSFVFDHWEKDAGPAALYAGRWKTAIGTLDVSPRPFGTYVGRLTDNNGKATSLVGITTPDGPILVSSAHQANLATGEMTIPATIPLTRIPSGKTPGAEKPADAITLFDGKNTDAFQPTKWKLVAPDAIEITRGSGGLTTKEKFGDMRLHLEFRQAYNPDTVGARRGNSGVMLMSYYEIALSDNFADPPQLKANGAIYGVAAPMVNASAAPLEWQSLLIDFTAPRFDADGKKIAAARVTAWQNGHLIHDNVAIVTPWEKNKPEPREPTALQLQQHGSNLQFRNIWAVKH